MKRIPFFLLFATASLVAVLPSPETGSVAPAVAQPADAAVKDAFEAARALGTPQAWEAFLAHYPTGFYADLARAYLNRGQAPAADVAAPAAPTGGAQAARSGTLSDLPPTDPAKPAVARGGTFMGFPERFNRYYTDPSWKPSRVVYVSPTGNGDGTRREAPASVRAAMASVRPGTQIHFLRGVYQGCFELTKERSGTYDEPIVLFAERNDDRSLGVTINCCNSGRQTCFNFEGADYVAVDGFELVGGNYGVRAIGEGYAASRHSRGIAVIDCLGHEQNRDPFFSGQADWAVWERLVAWGAKQGDGHGIYLSNGGDWNIVRFNETYANVSSDFQINADPDSTCKAEGIPFDDPRCDAFAGTGEGGQGASDYFLVDSNYFHHGAASGPNFTSVRRSVVRNNIFGIYPRHGVSFWQETDNPKLGSSENWILHNLFVTTGRHAVQFKSHSRRNEFVGNVLVGVRIDGTTVRANPSALLMEVDDTVGDNVYRSNLYVSGKLDGRQPNGEEVARSDFSATWFARFPTVLSHDPADFKPTAEAPFVGRAPVLPGAPTDRIGRSRAGAASLGPIEGP